LAEGGDHFDVFDVCFAHTGRGDGGDFLLEGWEGGGLEGGIGDEVGVKAIPKARTTAVGRGLYIGSSAICIGDS
jgi:hypothetical protein